MLNRRQFVRGLGASACLLPFLPANRAWAAAAPHRRLLLVWSLSTNHGLWRPTSAPGQPVVLSQALSPLQSVLGDIVLIDGLTPGNVNENHATPQTFTARGFDANSHISVDQYIAKQLGLSAPLLLGVEASSNSQFFDSSLSASSGGSLPPNDDPLSAYNVLFGLPVSSGTGVPRKSVLDLVNKQVTQLQQTLGSEERNKLQQHLLALASLEQTVNPSASCIKPTAPAIAGDPEAQVSTVAVGEAHKSLIVSALGCDLARVIGMQWGVTTTEYLSGTVNLEEHSMVHSVGQESQVIAAENYLCTWFADLIAQLKATADPDVAGKSLLDTTLVVWSRDFGHQSPGQHSNYGMPYVLAGATDYLATQPGGTYLNFGGDDATQTVGQPHEQLLLNLCEAMGVSDTSGFGSLTPGSASKVPLAQIKR